MTIKITDHYKLESAVADGLRDAVCPLKSCQLLHETQLPQSECVMLHVMMNGRTCRPCKPCMVSVLQVDAWAVRCIMQGGQSPGKPGKVRVFQSGQGEVSENGKSQGS